ncbi:MAG: DUF6265 family protein [Phycisphaerales bacterium JB037]
MPLPLAELAASILPALALAIAPPLTPLLPAHLALATQPEPVAEPLSTDDLTWLAGCWVIDAGDDYWEECWTDPHAGTMLGALRWLRDDQPRMYEIMVFEPEADRLSFKMRHFNPGLVPWAREADGPMDFTVTEITDQAFAMRADDGFTVRYLRRTDEQGVVQLEVTLGMVGPEGQSRTQQLLFTRKEH